MPTGPLKNNPVFLGLSPHHNRPPNTTPARLLSSDASVSERAQPFQMSLPAVSKHLRILERAGLISQQRQAQWCHCHLEAAPRELVFAVMSQPEHVRRWWGNLGEGYSVPTCEIDLRPGGAWRFINAHPKGQAEFYGTYQEVAPPSRVVFTEVFAPFPDSVSVVTAHLIEEDGKTRLIATSYDRLENLLTEKPALPASDFPQPLCRQTQIRQPNHKLILR